MVDREAQRQSKYNAGLLQMDRIHELLRAVNMANMRPTFRDENGMLGYEVLYSALTSLFMEASGKIKAPEREKFKVARDKIKRFMLTKQIMKPLFHKGGKSSGVVPTRNWLLLQEGLYEFQIMVRDLLEKTGLNSPEKGEEALI